MTKPNEDGVPLIDLDPEWHRNPGLTNRVGIWFRCPVCTGAHAGHSLLVTWAENTIHKIHWDKTGDTFETLTLSPSINCKHSDDGCQFHGFVKNGLVTWL